MNKRLKSVLVVLHLLFFAVPVILCYPICLILKVLNVRFLDVTTIYAIGHLALEPDSYIKETKLGLAKKYFMILDVPIRRIFNIYPRKIAANSALMDYWKKYYFVIRSPWLHFLLTPFTIHRLLKYDVSNYALCFLKPSKCPMIQKRYTKPLLELNSNHVTEGFKILSKWGIKKDDWFVCFHSRDENYRPDPEVSIRNSNIDSMFLGLKEIVNKGGFCIRVGRKTNPLPDRIKNLNKVIDYSQSEFVSDWMDLFLIGSCKFFFGSSNSGIKEVAVLFGIPALIINVFPFCGLPFRAIDLAIPRLYFSKKENKIMKFSEIVKLPQGNQMYNKSFEDFKIIDNSVEEIKEATLEMLARVNGNIQYDKEDHLLQEKFHSVFLPTNFCYGTSCRVGASFLRKYKDLF